MLILWHPHSFEFSISLPASAPVYDCGPEGEVGWQVTATLLGTSTIFSKDLSCSEWLALQANPWPDGDLVPLEEHLPFENSSLGSGSVHLYANVRSSSSLSHWAMGAARADITALLQPAQVAGALSVGVLLLTPPPTLSIFCVNLYIQQTAQLHSSRTGTRETRVRPKLCIATAGSQETRYGAPDFTARARRERRLLREARDYVPGAAVDPWKWGATERLVNSIKQPPESDVRAAHALRSPLCSLGQESTARRPRKAQRQTSDTPRA